MNEPVFLQNSNDPKMQKAVATAKKTFGVFWRELTWEYRRIVPALELACVKAAFTDQGDLENADDVEQMWVSEVRFDGRTVYGTLINQPNWLQSVAQGDDVELRMPEITDWMYAVQGVVYGGYTVNRMRADMGSGERKQHDRAWGLDFGSPEQVLLVPPDYLGDTKPGFLGRLTGKKLPDQDPKKVMSTEHPMAVNMVESLKEFASDPDNIASTDDYGLNLLHSLSLGGAARGVNALMELGADATVKTHAGMTPRRLAKRMGWRNVLKAFEKHGVDQ